VILRDLPSSAAIVMAFAFTATALADDNPDATFYKMSNCPPARAPGRSSIRTTPSNAWQGIKNQMTR
jgi:hypothetical protein